MKKGVDTIKVKCTDKVLRIANLVAVGGLFFWGILRFLSSLGLIGTGGFQLFLLFTSIYFLIFVAMLGFAWLEGENKYGIMVRTYFNFLDKIIGKGLFLIFLSMILVEKQD